MGDTFIEITPKDIIKRPLELVTGAAAQKKGNIISQFKSGLEQFKEIKSLLAELGIDLGDLLGAPKNTGSGMTAPPSATGNPPPAYDARAAAPPPPNPSAMSPAQQLKGMCVILQLKYGDCTIAEMLEKLKAEYGDRKISDFIKGK